MCLCVCVGGPWKCLLFFILLWIAQNYSQVLLLLFHTRHTRTRSCTHTHTHTQRQLYRYFLFSLLPLFPTGRCQGKYTAVCVCRQSPSDKVAQCKQSCHYQQCRNTLYNSAGYLCVTSLVDMSAAHINVQFEMKLQSGWDQNTIESSHSNSAKLTSQYTESSQA